jgi:hypothetical protein
MRPPSTDDSQAVRDALAADAADAQWHADRVPGGDRLVRLATAERLLAPEYVLNSPANRLQLRSETIANQTEASWYFEEFVRTVETAYASGDVVVVMGQEVVVLQGTGGPSDGRRMLRRFTNVWRRIEGEWRQIARHASVAGPAE